MRLTAEEIDHRVGAKLRFLREANGLTQAQLANAAGITFQQIQKYEHGSNRISASKLWQFCNVLSVEPNEFFDGLDEEIPGRDKQISRKVAETAWHLNQLKDGEVKRNMMELILLCESGNARASK